MPLKSFIAYLKLEKQYSAHTLTAYSADIKMFFAYIRTESGINKPEEVNYSMVRSWIVALSESNISNRSINRKIASLRAYYRFLQKIGSLEVSPLSKHKALKTNSKAQVPFSVNEVEAALGLINIGDPFTAARDKILITLFYTTGMRRSELINLKIEDINLGEKTLKVLGKRNKERFIPILEKLEVALGIYMEIRWLSFGEISESYVLLTNKGVKMYDGLVYRIINNYFSKVSNKTKTSPHILRHSFATHLLNNGADMNSVKELLGHTSLAATQIYTHNSIAQLRSVHGKAHPRSKKGNQ